MPPRRKRRPRPRLVGGQPAGGGRIDVLVRRIDWLFLLWARLGLQAEAADPALLRRVARAVPLERSLAAMLLAGLGASRSRQEVLGGVLGAEAAGEGDAGEYRVLWNCLGALDAEHGARLRRLIGAPMAKARGQVRRLTAGVPDPAARLSADAGRIYVVLCPTLWLPPPQDGRHAAIVEGADGPTVLMWFGMPAAARRAGAVTAAFLRDGIWVMWLRAYLRRACPWLHGAAPSGLGRLVAPALVGARRFRSAEDLVLRHLSVTLQAELFATLSGDAAHIREMALAQGYWWFDWFRHDLAARPAAVSLDAWLGALRARMRADRRGLRRAWQRPGLASTRVSVLFVEALHGGEVVLRLPRGLDPPTRRALRRRWAAVQVGLETMAAAPARFGAPRGTRRGRISVLVGPGPRRRRRAAPTVGLASLAPERRSWHVVVRLADAGDLGEVGPELLAAAGEATG